MLAMVGNGKQDCSFWEHLHLPTNVLSDQTLSFTTVSVFRKHFMKPKMWDYFKGHSLEI